MITLGEKLNLRVFTQTFTTEFLFFCLFKTKKTEVINLPIAASIIKEFDHFSYKILSCFLFVYGF